MASAPPWAGVPGGQSGGGFLSGIGGLPVVGGLLGGAGSLVSGIGNKKAAKQYADLYNNWLGQRSNIVGGPGGASGALGAINAGADPSSLGGLIGALAKSGTNIFGPQLTRTGGMSSGATTTSGTNKSQQRVAYNPEDQPNVGLTRSLVNQGLQEATSGFKPQVAAANLAAARTADAAKGKEQAFLAARGQGGAHALIGPAQREENAQIIQNQVQIPEALRGERMGQAMQWAGQNAGSNTAQQYGSSTNQTMNYLQSVMSPPDYAKLLAFLSPPSPQQGTAGMGTANVGNTLGGLGAFL